MLVGANLVVLERHPNPQSKRSFLRDLYRIVAVSLADGERVFAAEIKREGQPVQIQGTYLWRDSVVVFGYHQHEPGLFNKEFSITVVDREGKMTKQFPIAFPCRALAVDESRNALLCLQDRDKLAKDPQVLDPQVLWILELPSGKEVSRENVPVAEHLTADNEGGLYVLRTPANLDDYMMRKVDKAVSQIEKYSIDPWAKLWSVEVRPERGYPCLIAVEQGTVCYAIYDEGAGSLLDEKIKWIGGPLDPSTSKELGGGKCYDPYRMDVEVAGKQYVITKAKEGLRVVATKR